MENISIYFERNGLPYEGFFRPVFSDDFRSVFQLTLYNRFLGNLMLTSNGWEMQGGYPKHLAWFFGDYISTTYGEIGGVR